MKFLFINKPFFIEPLGLMYLASSMKNQGHDVDLVLTNEDYKEKVRTFKPDFIGYSIMTGDQGFYDNINQELKKIQDFISIAGGPHPTFFQEMLSKTSFDAICRGEGEETINLLLKEPDSKSIPNFHFKSNGEIIENPVMPLIENLDSIPFPDRDLVFKYSDIKNGPIKHFIGTRGCPYKCSYCFNESYSALYDGKGKRVRYRSIDNIIEEVKEVVESSLTKFVYFQDDTFVLRKDFVREFSEKYPKKIGLPFHCHTRANLMDNELAGLLKDAGCYSVHIAAESGNDEVRRTVLNRVMSNEQIINSVKILKDHGIKSMLQNILGLPFTTLYNDLETLDLNIKCQPDYAWASIFQPYPRTVLGERCVDEGIYTGDFSDISNNFYEGSVLNIENKNEIANLQKIFAVVVKHPEIYYSGKLQKLLELPHEKYKDLFSNIYNTFRKKADKILYGVDL